MTELGKRGNWHRQFELKSRFRSKDTYRLVSLDHLVHLLWWGRKKRTGMLKMEKNADRKKQETSF